MNSMDNQAYGMSAGPQGSQADLHSRLRAAGALAEELCGYAGQNLSAGDAGVLRAALTALFLAGGDTGMFLPLGGESTAEFLGRYIREAEDAHDRDDEEMLSSAASILNGADVRSAVEKSTIAAAKSSGTEKPLLFLSSDGKRLSISVSHALDVLAGNRVTGPEVPEMADFLTGLSGLNGDDAEAFRAAAAALAAAYARQDSCLPLEGGADGEFGDFIDENFDISGQPWNYKLAYCCDLIRSRLLSGDIEELLRKSPAVSDDEESQTPLKLYSHHLYYRRYADYERNAALRLGRLAAKSGIPEDSRDEYLGNAKKYLDILFDPSGEKDEADRQDLLAKKTAAALSVLSDLTVITGGPGTGKTFAVTKILLLQRALRGKDEDLRILLAAPTGKAAARLKESIANAMAPAENALSESARKFSESLQRLSDETGIDRIGFESALLTVPMTIHSMIKAVPNNAKALRNHEHPLTADIIVIDETSMVDLAIMAKLLDAIDLRTNTKLILLGDSHQLSSVETGSVFGDISSLLNESLDEGTRETLRMLAGFDPAESGDRPQEKCGRHAVEFTRSHRFRDDSGIGKLRNEILSFSGSDGSVLFRPSDDRHITEFSDRAEKLPQNPSGEAAVAIYAAKNCANPEQAIHDMAISAALGELRSKDGSKEGSVHNYRNYFAYLVDSLGKAAGGTVRRPLKREEYCKLEDGKFIGNLFRHLDDFRIICSNRNGLTGTIELNRSLSIEILREFGTPSANKRLQLSADEIPLFEGLPIMITRNDRNLGVNNGDIGIILRTESGWDAVFPDSEQKPRFIPFTLLPDSETALAITVHKSQGSEFTHTLMVTPSEYNRVLTKELLYTGITRARKWLTLIGTKDVIVRAAGEETRRSSCLRERLTEREEFSFG
jgi:exodeoxyribonuclease V alpha subunit